jgi:hypothetical protein
MNILENMDETIERLITLEYAIRKSMTVREDQDEPADLQHTDVAKSYGVSVEDGITKGDLLSAVQTLVRAKQKLAVKSINKTLQ